MIPVCECSNKSFTIQNLGGFETCPGGMGIIKGGYFMSLTKLNGDVNGDILASTTPNKAFMDVQALNPIIQDRWFHYPNILSYDSPVVDPDTEEIDGEIFQGEENTKQVSWVTVTDEAPKMKAKLDSIVNCNDDIAFMPYDAKGNRGGEVTATHFIGRKIQKGSYFSQVQEGVRGAKARLIVTFNWDESALETAVDYISQDVMEGFKASRDTITLIDGRIAYGASNLADISFNVFNDIGGVNIGGVISKNPLGALTETHLVAEDVTVPASPIDVPGTITETHDGAYVFTYTSAIAAGKTISIRPIGWDLATPNYIGLTYDLKDLVLQSAPTVSA